MSQRLPSRAAPPSDTGWEGPMAALAVGLVVALAGVAGALELGALIEHHTWVWLPSGGMEAVASTVFRHPGNPEAAWPSPWSTVVPGRGMLWTLLVLETAAAVGLAMLVIAVVQRRGHGVRDDRQRGRRQARQGFASSAMVRRHLSAAAALRMAPRVLPSVAAPSLGAVGLYLGRAQSGRELWATREDSITIIGPPRSGKSRHLAVPLLRRAAGPQLIFSPKLDLLRWLGFLEEWSDRPLWVIDFEAETALDGKPRGRLPWDRCGWDLVAGCQHIAVATLRSEALVGVAGGTATAGGPNREWRARATQLITAALHAAAIAGEDASWVHRIVNTEDLTTLAQVLRTTPGAAVGWGEIVEGIDRLPYETRGGITFGAVAVLQALDNPEVRDICSPRGRRPLIDVEALLDQGGRLFIISGEHQQRGTLALITAMVESIVAVAKARAARSQGERLVPPLTVCIDEMASCPLRSAPELAQSGGGRGITPVFLFQNVAQIRQEWGDHGASAIVSNSTAKVVLGGLTEARDLEALSKLTPEIRRPTRSRSRDDHGSRTSVTEGERWTRALDAADVREIPDGRSLVWFRSLRPLEGRLTVWNDRRGRGPDDRACGEAQRRFDAAMRAANQRGALVPVPSGAP